MRICVDARWIFPEISGIGFYTRELIRGIARRDRTNEYVLLFNNSDVLDRTRPLFEAPGFRCEIARVGYGPFSPSGQLLLPRLLRRLGVDVFHSTNYMMPLAGCGRVRRVVTVHDMIPLLFPQHTPRALKTRLLPLYKGLMHEVARRADLVIAVSESTRRDILRVLGAPRGEERRVVVIPEAASPDYSPPDPRPSPLSSPSPLILFVGRRDPYKNLELLIRAFGELRERGVQARLRVIGSPDNRYPEAPRLAERLGLQPFIEWTGYVPPGDLVGAYQAADVYVLPSLYEGFGLTVLEAMACGTPVICSGTSSLPEVAGDAAILLDPSDRAAWVDALGRVLTDKDLAADLSARGLRRAAEFSWERTAEMTVRAYDAVAK
jgi:glycosyltransferase involved in cell wall biosynthesis